MSYLISLRRGLNNPTVHHQGAFHMFRHVTRAAPSMHFSNCVQISVQETDLRVTDEFRETSATMDRHQVQKEQKQGRSGWQRILRR